jgi:hypothetical protein
VGAQFGCLADACISFLTTCLPAGRLATYLTRLTLFFRPCEDAYAPGKIATRFGVRPLGIRSEIQASALFLIA